MFRESALKAIKIVVSQWKRRNATLFQLFFTILRLICSKILSNSCDDDSDGRKPDADSLKMFVGQIPKEWAEAECRQLLEPFGEIFALNLLKDKRTSKSKGIWDSL